MRQMRRGVKLCLPGVEEWAYRQFSLWDALGLYSEQQSRGVSGMVICRVRTASLLIRSTLNSSTGVDWVSPQRQGAAKTSLGRKKKVNLPHLPPQSSIGFSAVLYRPMAGASLLCFGVGVAPGSQRSHLARYTIHSLALPLAAPPKRGSRECCRCRSARLGGSSLEIFGRRWTDTA